MHDSEMRKYEAYIIRGLVRLFFAEGEEDSALDKVDLVKQRKGKPHCFFYLFFRIFYSIVLVCNAQFVLYRKHDVNQNFIPRHLSSPQLQTKPINLSLAACIYRSIPSTAPPHHGDLDTTISSSRRVFHDMI